MQVYILLASLLSGIVSQNHSRVKVGRDLFRSSRPPFLSKRGQPEPVSLPGPRPFEYLYGYEIAQPFWATTTNVQLTSEKTSVSSCLALVLSLGTIVKGLATSVLSLQRSWASAIIQLQLPIFPSFFFSNYLQF